MRLRLRSCQIVRDFSLPHLHSPPSPSPPPPPSPLPQGHLQLLEGTPENQQALLLGLDYLVNLSYVDNIEVGEGSWEGN